MPTFQEGSRGEDSARREGDEAASLESQMRFDSKSVASRRSAIEKSIALAGGSPQEIQVSFIKGLIENREEARKFRDDPKSYAVDHGVLLSPELVKDVTNSLLFDIGVPDSLVGKIGPKAASELLDLRANASVAAVPAAVVAGAAVVAAAAAVVEAVVTVVRTSHAADLVSLKGLGPKGVRMPGGGGFRF